MMQYKKLFIDLSNFYYRAYYAGQYLSTTLDDGVEIITGGIVLSLRMLQRLEKDFLAEDGQVFFLFDNCHSGINKRKEIDPEYKSNRTKKDEVFYRSIDFLHLILLNYKDNYFMVKKEGMEADDLVESLVKRYDEDSILLISNDIDWFRAISDKVHVAKYENNDYHIYDEKEFINKFGFKPTVKNMCIYKSIRGDKGDNVPIGIPGLRTDTLVKLIEDFDSIQDICRNVKQIQYLTDTFKQKFIENTPRLLMNYKLVNYLSVSQEELEDAIYKANFSPRILHNLYSSLNFDISKTDPRVAQFFVNKEKSSKSFFKLEKIPRV